MQLLRVSIFMLLIPMVNMASDAMDTSDDVGQARLSRRRPNQSVANAAEPRTHPCDAETPSFVIIRPERDPMQQCAYVLNAQSTDQLALVPEVRTKSLKTRFRIMRCTYAGIKFSFNGVLNEPTLHVSDFHINNPEDNLYPDFNQGLRALLERMRIVDGMVVRERVPASILGRYNALSQSTGTIQRRNAD